MLVDLALGEEVIDLAASRPQLEELQRAAYHQGRWNQSLSLVIASSQVEMVAALHTNRKYVAASGSRARTAE